VVLVAVAALAGRADAQSGPLLPDPDPSAGLRVEGPLLPARPPGPVPAPPPNDPGPFRAVVPGSGPAALGDAAAAGPEPIQQPLLVVPPAAPPLPPMPPTGPILSELVSGTGRSTQIRAPVGVLGEATDGLCKWFNDTLLWGDKPYKYVTLPDTLLWKIPLAAPREPRFYGKFFNIGRESFIDTAIGGEFGLGRVAPRDSDDEGIQLDGFGAVFTRFNGRRFLTAADYRAGIPLTYKKGPWSTKISYEHTSTHIGDEFSQNTGRRQVPLVLDETVLGVSRYFFEQTLRFYGQYGYAFNTSKETNANRRSRFDLGVSYSQYADTGPGGRPYLAYDMDLREYQNYHVNSTFQAGWQWVHHGRSARIGVEVYDGRSQYGQFFLNREHYVAFAGYYDW
jgi:hypothetical protein